MLGEEPQWVFADLHQPEGDERFGEVEERVSWTMGFSGGVVAHCLTSYAAQSTSTLRVLGEKGSVLMDPAFDYQGLKLTIEDSEGKFQPSFPAYDQFGNEFDHFAQCIREGKTPWTPRRGRRGRPRGHGRHLRKRPHRQARRAEACEEEGRLARREEARDARRRGVIRIPLNSCTVGTTPPVHPYREIRIFSYSFQSD